MRCNTAATADTHYRRRIATILEDLALDLERLGTALCTDAGVSRAHGARLQAIDLIAQKQLCLASLLHSDDIAAALEDVPLDELRETLTAP